eukprot:gene5791-6377_t
MHFCQSLIPTSFNRRSFVGQAGADLVEQALVQAFVDLDRVQRTVPVKEDSEGIEVINEAGCAAVWVRTNRASVKNTVAGLDLWNFTRFSEIHVLPAHILSSAADFWHLRTSTVEEGHAVVLPAAPLGGRKTAAFGEVNGSEPTG